MDGASRCTNASSALTVCFERLVRKYSKRVGTISPEMQLIIMMVGNAFTFCFTKAMLKSVQPSMTKVAEENPELIKNMMEKIMREQMAKGQVPSFVNTQEPEYSRVPFSNVPDAGGMGDFMAPPMATRAYPDSMPRQEADMSGPGEERRGSKHRKKSRRSRRDYTSCESEESGDSTSIGSEATSADSRSTSDDSEATVSLVNDRKRDHKKKRRVPPKAPPPPAVLPSNAVSPSVSEQDGSASSLGISVGTSSLAGFKSAMSRKPPAAKKQSAGGGFASKPGGGGATIRRVTFGSGASGGQKVAKLQVDLD